MRTKATLRGCLLLPQLRCLTLHARLLIEKLPSNQPLAKDEFLTEPTLTERKQPSAAPDMGFKSYINTHDRLAGGGSIPPSASISLLALIYLYIFFIAHILLSYRMINGDNVMKSTNLPPDEEAVWWWWQRSVQKDMGATMEP